MEKMSKRRLVERFLTEFLLLPKPFYIKARTKASVWGIRRSGCFQMYMVTTQRPFYWTPGWESDANFVKKWAKSEKIGAGEDLRIPASQEREAERIFQILLSRRWSRGIDLSTIYSY